MTTCRTALVTGATGFIGQHLIRRLLDENIAPYCLVRAGNLTPRLRERLTGAEWLTLESDTEEAWATALRGIRADVVFHLASAGVLPGAVSPQIAIETNVRLMCRLLTAVAGWPVRNIFCAGTFSEYVDSCEAWTEDSPLVPATTYGASKAAAWMCGRALALELGLPLVNLRLFHVYGPGESERRLIPYLYSQLSRRRPASLTSGTQVRDVVYVEDVAEAFYAATMLPPAMEPAVFNVCSGTAVTIRQIGETVARQLGVPASLLRWGEVPHRPRESLHALGDNRRFFQATGWQPRVTLADGIAQTLESLGWHGRLQQAG